MTLAVAVPEIVGALLLAEAGVLPDVVCAEVEEPEPPPPPPQAANSEDSATEQKAKRTHEPETVLILCDPINDPTRY